jgi:hypothetical protein
MSSALTRWHQLSKKAQWLIAIGALFGVFMIIGAFSNSSDSTSSSSSAPATSSSSSSPDYSAPEPVEESFSSETSGQENAREQAENYLDTSAFSRKGLIDQLEYEGYSTADATYAVDAITVDWSEQAALKAEQYLDTSSFSRSGLLDQLLYEGFTRAQASYGVSIAY